MGGGAGRRRQALDPTRWCSPLLSSRLPPKLEPEEGREGGGRNSRTLRRTWPLLTTWLTTPHPEGLKPFLLPQSPVHSGGRAALPSVPPSSSTAESDCPAGNHHLSPRSTFLWALSYCRAGAVSFTCFSAALGRVLGTQGALNKYLFLWQYVFRVTFKDMKYTAFR